MAHSTKTPGSRSVATARRRPPSSTVENCSAGLDRSDLAMSRLTSACATAIVLCALASAPRAQSVYPTGTTIYDPDKSWNGFTVLSPLGTQAVLVIDMNGNVVKRWDDFNNSAGGPARVLPGGGVIGAKGARPPYQESLELVQR